MHQTQLEGCIHCDTLQSLLKLLGKIRILHIKNVLATYSIVIVNYSILENCFFNVLIYRLEP